MRNESLTRYADRLSSLTAQRTELAREIFEWLSHTDPELAELAAAAFDSDEGAALWLIEDVPSLGDKMPLALLLQEERQKVVDCLLQVQHGVYS